MNNSTISDIFARINNCLFMKRIFLIFLISLIPFYAVNAQKVWSLQNCIDYALANNIQIKQQQLSEQLAKITLNQSKIGLIPSVNGAASHAYNYGKTIDMYTNDFASSTVQSDNFYLSSNVTLFSGFQLLNTIKQNKIDLQASQFDLEKMMNDISLNLATAYLQILYNIEILNNAESQLDITNQQVKRTQKLYDAGTVAKGTLLTLEAQAATEELSVVNAQNSLDLSYLTLTQMLDLTTTDSFDIEIPKLELALESAELTAPDQIFAFAYAKQPEIKSAELKVRSNEIGLSIARGMRSPSLSLRFSYGTGYSGASDKYTSSFGGYEPSGFTSGGDTVYSPYFETTKEKIPFDDQIKDNVNKSISFNLSVPLFNGWQTNAAISKSKIAIQNAEYSLQTTKNTLYKTIQQAYADALAALNKYKSSRKSVEALKESFKYTEQKFDVGLVNTTDYNDAKNKLAESQSNLLQAKYEYVFRLKILDFYMGKPIELK
jgi:outer membrane protein